MSLSERPCNTNTPMMDAYDRKPSACENITQHFRRISFSGYPYGLVDDDDVACNDDGDDGVDEGGEGCTPPPAREKTRVGNTRQSQTREDKNNVPSLDDAVKELNWKLTGEPEAAPSEHFSPQSESLPPVEECRVYREHDCGDHQVRGIGEQV